MVDDLRTETLRPEKLILGNWYGKYKGASDVIDLAIRNGGREMWGTGYRFHPMKWLTRR
jgi:hypothetical protein